MEITYAVKNTKHSAWNITNAVVRIALSQLTDYTALVNVQLDNFSLKRSLKRDVVLLEHTGMEASANA